MATVINALFRATVGAGRQFFYLGPRKPIVPKGEYLLAQAAFPGAAPENIGILLLDPAANRLYCRFRRDTKGFAGGEADWFEHLADDIREKSQELGARQSLAWMKSMLPRALWISERESVLVDDYGKTADRLYAKHIRPRVLPFLTHLPLYSLEAAAGRFGEQMDVQPEGWIEVHPNIPLAEDMFVTRVIGRSMEPMIPDHSFCAFRPQVFGSYSGKVVLVEHYGEKGGDRYTVKRYHISTNPDRDKEGDAAWLHERVTLESVNPDYKSWDVPSAVKIRVIAVFIFVV